MDEVGRDDLLVHAANSAATLRDPASHFDMVRCGVAIYGLDPFQGDPAAHGLEPALSLHSWVAALRRFEPGDSAGYGRRWRAAEPTWVATVPIGYGDGWRRGAHERLRRADRRPALPARGHREHGQRDRGAGRGPGRGGGRRGGADRRQGGERILAEEVARRLGTINYEVTSGLLPRVRREPVR